MDFRIKECEPWTDYHDLVAQMELLANHEQTQIIRVFKADCESLEDVTLETVEHSDWLMGQEILDELWATTDAHAVVGQLAAYRAKAWAAIWMLSNDVIREKEALSYK